MLDQPIKQDFTVVIPLNMLLERAEAFVRELLSESATSCFHYERIATV